MKKFIVILAGGEGKRLRHKTGKDCPKQFFRATPDEQNMLEMTFARLQNLKMRVGGHVVTVIKEKNHAALNACQFKGANNVVFEPETCKNTAPAIFNTICSFAKEYGESLFAFFPVDHKVDDETYFTNLLTRVMRLAEKVNKLFLLGSPTSSINSQLGYIVPKRSDVIVEGAEVYPLQAFVEKPDEAKIMELVPQNPLVNMGVFIGKASVFLEAFIKVAYGAREDGQTLTGDSFDREILPSVLEQVLVFEYKSTWSDCGMATQILGDEQVTTDDLQDLAEDTVVPAAASKQEASIKQMEV